MLSPKFSIIIPVYNVAPYLRQCLDSVINQDYSDYEIICVNDGSIDGSLFILEEYKKKYPQINLISQDNKGLSAARNTGIKAATGDYILFLDSDDWLENNALKILHDNIAGEDMLCFNGRRYFENGTQEEQDAGISETNLTGWNYYNKYALTSRKFHFVCTVLRLYKREFLLQNNLFFKEGIFHEDNLFTPIACYYAQSVKVIPDTLYVYRIRSGSIMLSTNLKHLYDTILVANLLSEFFIPIKEINKTNIYREIAGEYFKWFMHDQQRLYKISNKELKKLINWNYFKEVSIYPRHKRIFLLSRVNPILLRFYLCSELRIKSLIKK
jgi:glycosyltransferase involved in cell wall biosynthesis